MLHHIHNFHEIYSEKLFNPRILQSCGAWSLRAAGISSPGLCRHSKMDAVSKNVGIMSIAGFLARTQFSADGSQGARGVKLVNKASPGHELGLCRVTEN